MEPAVREIEIRARARAPVRADLRKAPSGGGRALVVVCHGFLGYKRWGFFPYLSDRLAGAGFDVLTMSFSLNGVDEATGLIERPGDFARNTVSAEIADLRAVLAFVRSGALDREGIDGRALGLFGHSRGAAVALLAAGECPEARSIVTWSTLGRLDRYTARRKAAWKKEGALVFNDPRARGPLRLDYSYYEDIDARRETFDIPRAAAALSIPHLMVHGERDARGDAAGGPHAAGGTEERRREARDRSRRGTHLQRDTPHAAADGRPRARGRTLRGLVRPNARDGKEGTIMNRRRFLIAIAAVVVAAALIATLVSSRQWIAHTSYRRAGAGLAARLNPTQEKKYGNDLRYTLDKFWEFYEKDLVSQNDLNDVMEKTKSLRAKKDVTDMDIFDYIRLRERALYGSDAETSERYVSRMKDEPVGELALDVAEILERDVLDPLGAAVIEKLPLRENDVGVLGGTSIAVPVSDVHRRESLAFQLLEMEPLAVAAARAVHQVVVGKFDGAQGPVRHDETVRLELEVSEAEPHEEPVDVVIEAVARDEDGARTALAEIDEILEIGIEPFVADKGVEIPLIGAHEARTRSRGIPAS